VTVTFPRFIKMILEFRQPKSIHFVERKNNMKSTGIGSLIINIFTFVSGLAALVGGVWFMQVDTSNWISVEGQVVSSSGSNYSDSGSEYSTYEYTVDGAKYQGSSSIGYDVGQKITVYYDPMVPSDSTETPGDNKLLGSICILFGLWTVGIYAWKFIKTGRTAKQKDTTGV
jgi:hypothetical protein